MISTQLDEALQRKGWSITEASKQADVDRSFLSRLMSGKTPPRTKRGRKNARHDERYMMLAKALGLDEKTFIDEVVRLQQGFAPVPSEHREKLFQAVWSEIRDDLPNNTLLIHLPTLISEYLSHGLEPGRAEAVQEAIMREFEDYRRPSYAVVQQDSELPGTHNLGDESGIGRYDSSFADFGQAHAMVASDRDREFPDAQLAPEFRNMTRREIPGLFRRIGDAVIDAEVPIEIKVRVPIAGMFYALATRFVPSFKAAIALADRPSR